MRGSNEILDRSKEQEGSRPASPRLPGRQETYYADFTADLRESAAGHDAVLPLAAVELHGQHRVDQGLRERNGQSHSLFKTIDSRRGYILSWHPAD